MGLILKPIKGEIMNMTMIESNNGKNWKILGLTGIALLVIALIAGISGFFSK